MRRAERARPCTYKHTAAAAAAAITASTQWIMHRAKRGAQAGQASSAAATQVASVTLTHSDALVSPSCPTKCQPSTSAMALIFPLQVANPSVKKRFSFKFNSMHLHDLSNAKSTSSMGRYLIWQYSGHASTGTPLSLRGRRTQPCHSICRHKPAPYWSPGNPGSRSKVELLSRLQAADKDVLVSDNGEGAEGEGRHEDAPHPAFEVGP